MARKIEPGHYKLGETKEVCEDIRGDQRLCTYEYGVVKGQAANSASNRGSEPGHVYWGHLCPGALHRTKWFAYRVEIDPGTTRDARPQLLTRADDKSTAADWVLDRVGDSFSRSY